MTTTQEIVKTANGESWVVASQWEKASTKGAEFRLCVVEESFVVAGSSLPKPSGKFGVYCASQRPGDSEPKIMFRPVASLETGLAMIREQLSKMNAS